MQTLNIKAFTKDDAQVKAIKEFLKSLKIDFEVIDQKEYQEFLSEVLSSLNQVNKIQMGELPKQSARDFLNEI